MMIIVPIDQMTFHRGRPFIQHDCAYLCIPTLPSLCSSATCCRAFRTPTNLLSILTTHWLLSATVPAPELWHQDLPKTRTLSRPLATAAASAMLNTWLRFLSPLNFGGYRNVMKQCHRTFPASRACSPPLHDLGIDNPQRTSFVFNTPHHRLLHDSPITLVFTLPHGVRLLRRSGFQLHPAVMVQSVLLPVLQIILETLQPGQLVRSVSTLRQTSSSFFVRQAKTYLNSLPVLSSSPSTRKANGRPGRGCLTLRTSNRCGVSRILSVYVSANCVKKYCSWKPLPFSSGGSSLNQ